MRPLHPDDPDHLRNLDVDQPFTFVMAREAGVGRKQLAALVECGYLRHPIRNMYVVWRVPDSLPLRARMLSLVVPPDCFVCDRTAAWLHGAPAALAPNEHLSVPAVSCFRPSDQDRLRNGLAVSGERWVTPDDLMELNGVLVTTPLRTALDLGRLQRNRDIALAGMDAMLRLGGFTHDELLAEVPRFRRQRGVVQLRVLSPLADGRAESAAESALRLRWYDAALPRPELQIEVVVDGQVVFRLDIGIEELLFAAEYDGVTWHSSDEQVESDRSRRTWLVEQRRWLIEVFRKADVYGLHQNADVRLRRAFLHARATLGQRTFII